MHSKLYIRIMNSKEWKVARARKLLDQPLCEICKAKGIIKAANVVHHLTEVETGKSDEECWHLATSYNNLQSLCFRHHHLAHTKAKSHTRETHIERNNTRIQQFINRHRNDTEEQTKPHTTERPDTAQDTHAEE